MEIKVKLSNLRIAPQKTRKVIDLIRGKSVLQAQSILSFTVNKSARDVLKLLNSALAAARNDLKLDELNLFVSKVTVDEGPKLKRWHAMSKGRAYPIIKRSSHIVLVLSEKIEDKEKSKSKDVVSVTKQERGKIQKSQKKENSKVKK